MKLIYGITLLLAYQLVGEVGVRALDLPVPGPVAGMLLLFLTLVALGRVPESLSTSAGGLLSHLSLLFVPAGVGIMVHAERIGAEWLPIALALVLSTLLTMAVTAWVMLGTRRLVDRWRPDDER
ncbi:MAG: CidA/LrgA family protein [Gammaproteobacteria bacterium]|nr:CidA/LrgA family protein [Gammaproteobacteria bacterium]